MRKTKRWTKTNSDALVRMFATTPDTELARVFDVTVSSLRGRAYKLGLRKAEDFKSARVRVTAADVDLKVRRIHSGIVVTDGNSTIHRMGG